MSHLLLLDLYVIFSLLNAYEHHSVAMFFIKNYAT